MGPSTGSARGNGWWIGFAVLIAAIGLYAVLDSPAVGPLPEVAVQEPPAVPGAGVPEARLREASGPAADAPDERAQPEVRSSQPLPDGRPVGTIQGFVRPPRGMALPGDARVVLNPSATLIGSDFARQAETAVDTDGRFAFVDLPLAGYDVRAHWSAGASELRPVLLRAGREEALIELTLTVRASARGRVVDSNGLAVPDIEVALAPASASRFTPEPFARSRSDDAGLFRFDHVPDGDWQVLVGPLTAPATEPLRFTLEGADLTLPSIEVPALATLALTVTDEFGGNLPHIDVRGFGDSGGLIRGTTDAFGRYDATLLPPGRYRLRVNDAEHGLGQRTVRIHPGTERVETTLVLRR